MYPLPLNTPPLRTLQVAGEILFPQVKGWTPLGRLMLEVPGCVSSRRQFGLSLRGLGLTNQTTWMVYTGQKETTNNNQQPATYVLNLIFPRWLFLKQLKKMCKFVKLANATQSLPKMVCVLPLPVLVWCGLEDHQPVKMVKWECEQDGLQYYFKFGQIHPPGPILFLLQSASFWWIRIDLFSVALIRMF